MASREFDNYIIYHQAERNSAEKVIINCYIRDTAVGYIHFYEGDLPEPEMLPTGALKLTFDYARYSEIINTIRYEKPLFISLYGEKSMISTVREPVGEQEGT